MHPLMHMSCHFTCQNNHNLTRYSHTYHTLHLFVTDDWLSEAISNQSVHN